MKFSRTTLLRGVGWTVSVFAGAQLLRFASNVVLTRLLSPELFGIVAIVHSVRMGIELLSDVGIAQNLVYNRNSDKPEFYNTAWTLQVARGLLLWLVSCICAVPMAHIYNAPILIYVIPVASSTFIFSGF